MVTILQAVHGNHTLLVVTGTLSWLLGLFYHRIARDQFEMGLEIGDCGSHFRHRCIAKHTQDKAGDHAGINASGLLRQHLKDTELQYMSDKATGSVATKIGQSPDSHAVRSL